VNEVNIEAKAESFNSFMPGESKQSEDPAPIYRSGE